MPNGSLPRTAEARLVGVGTSGDAAPVPHRAPVAEYVPRATLVAVGLARQYDHILESLSAKVYFSAAGLGVVTPKS